MKGVVCWRIGNITSAKIHYCIFITFAHRGAIDSDTIIDIVIDINLITIDFLYPSYPIFSIINKFIRDSITSGNISHLGNATHRQFTSFAI